MTTNYKQAEAALLQATGAKYSVDTWHGYEAEEGENEWLAPVYASMEDEEREGERFDAVADAGVDGWIAWLIEQAMEG